MNAAKDRHTPNVTSKTEAARQEREAKLAEALRENLGRRKTQRRVQDTSDAKTEE